MTSDEQRAASGPGIDPTSGTVDRMSNSPANGPTNGSTDPARLDLLDRYWDATTGNGFQRAEAIALDPVRARTVDLLQTLTHEQTVTLPADARARIWRETAAQAGIPTQQEPTMASPSSPAGGLAAPGLTLPASTAPRRRHSAQPGRPGGPITPGSRWAIPGGGGPAQPTGRTWWPRLQFAVAAALILGLFATILAPMDDGRVGLFGGISDDATPTAASALTLDAPISVALPAADEGHTITLDQVVVPVDGMVELAPGLFHAVWAQSGSASVLTLNVPGSTGQDIDPGQPGPVTGDLGGLVVNATSDGPAAVRVLTIAPLSAPGNSFLPDVIADRLATYTTTNFAGQSEAEGVLRLATTSSYYDQFTVPGGAFGPYPFRPGETQAFVYTDSGSVQINSPGRQAQLVSAGAAVPGDLAVDIDLAVGDAAIVGDATTANFRTGPSGEDGTLMALILAPRSPATPQAIVDSATPTGSQDDGQTGQLTLPIRPYTTEAIIALERITIEAGSTWTVGEDSASIAVWVSGPATIARNGAMVHDDTNPVQTAEFVTLEPNSSIMALGPDSVIFDRAVLYPTLTPPTQASVPGVTVAQLGWAPIQNVANATSVEVNLREGVTGPDPQSPFVIPEALAADQVMGVFAVTSGNLDASTTNARMQPSTTGGQANALRATTNESILTYGLEGITVTTAAGETAPATFISAFATIQFASAAATPGTTLSAPMTLLDTTVDASAANPFMVSIEQHVMGPDASYLFRFGDAPGGTIVTWVADGSATLSMDGQDPVELSAGTLDSAVSELAAIGNLRIVPGPDGATLYHAQIGIPFPLNGTGGAEGNGTLAVNYIGSWADDGFDGPVIFPRGAAASAQITLSLGSTSFGPTEFIAETGGVLLAPLDGTVRVTSESGPVNLGGLLSFGGSTPTGPPEPGQIVALTPGQNVNSSPGGVFTVEGSENPATYLTLQLAPSDDPPTIPVTTVTSPITNPNSYTGGGGILDIPVSQDGHLVSINRLSVSAGARQELPAGASYLLQSLRGDFTIERSGVAEPVAVTDSSVVDVGLDGGAIVAGNDGILVTVLSISPLQDRPFWLFAVGGSAPLTLYETTDLIGMAQANVVLGRGPVPTEPEVIPPFGTSGMAAELTDPATILLFAAERNATTITSTEPLLVNVGQGATPSEPVADLTIEPGNTAVVRDPAAATIHQARPDEPALYTSVVIAPVAPVSPTEATPAATPSTPVADIPAIGYPDAFTGGGLLVDLPVSAAGHRVSIDRVTIAGDSTLTLPPGAVYQAASVTGQFTVERGGSSPLIVDQPSIVDVTADGGSLLADHGADVTVTVLTIAPDGAPPMASSDGITVYPLSSYETGGFRFESQLNVLFGDGPVPVDPEPVGPSANPDDPTNLTNPDATMLLYAEQGTIRITASADVIEDPASSDEIPVSGRDLTIAAGETAVVRNPSLATIQQATPGEGAVYTVAFLAPPGLDRTVGRTYPNMGGGATITAPTDGDDYRIVLDRLTLDPGATATFAPGIFQMVQWTGGGTATLISNETILPPFMFDERSLTGTFQDQGGRLVATGDTPVTMTLMSYLPAGSSDVTVAAGQTGLTTERLTTYTVANPFDTNQARFLFAARAARGYPVDIALGLDQDLGNANPRDSYALIRPEGGPIVLNRPARRIVDGAETTEIAAGVEIAPGETVRVDDLRDATLQGPTDGTPAGYTLVVISPYDDPSGNGPNANGPAEPTGLTPASLDTVASVPADGPLTMQLVRQTLAPDATMTINPVYAADGVSIPPITVVSYAATGDATISLAGEAGTELSDRSDQVAMSSLTSATPITIRAGADGITVYQLVIGPAPPEFSVNGAETTSGTEILGAYSGDDLFAGTGSAGYSVDIQVMLRSSVNALGEGSSQTLGRDSAITLLTPLAGDALITPGVGEVRVAATIGDDPSGTVATTPTIVAPGGSVLALPGGVFRLAAGTDTDTLSFLSVEILVSPGGQGASPDATPAAATPAIGTPDADTVPACDITPRTVEELLTLYDEGVANPVDPVARSHRDDLGTGTLADDATVDAVTDTLLRQSACTNLDDPLRRYALESDDALRYALPLIYESRDDVASLLEQPLAGASEAAIGSVTVSDVELFADGRVGARVAFETEFAYVTFTQASDGTWLVDVFDDRYEPGA